MNSTLRGTQGHVADGRPARADPADDPAPAARAFDLPDATMDDDIGVEASHFAVIMAGQLLNLFKLTEGLEAAMSRSLSQGNALTEDNVMTLQRLDYVRQALKDMERLLHRFGPSLIWSQGTLISARQLVDTVDMRDSIRPLLVAAGQIAAKAPPRQEAGEIDLW